RVEGDRGGAAIDDLRVKKPAERRRGRRVEQALGPPDVGNRMQVDRPGEVVLVPSQGDPCTGQGATGRSTDLEPQVDDLAVAWARAGGQPVTVSVPRVRRQIGDIRVVNRSYGQPPRQLR